MEARKSNIISNNLRVIFVTLLLTVSFWATSQKDTVLIKTDSLLVTGESVAKKKTVKYYSPHKATLYSAILPGMGQIYNKKYWKAPIVWIGLGISGYALYYNQKEYNYYKSAYRDYIINDPANKSYQPTIDRFVDAGVFTEDELVPGGKYSQWFSSALNNQKTYLRKNRDYSYVAIGLIYVINIIDATVDAHFKQFDISDDLTMRWEPIVNPTLHNGPNYGLGLNFSFK